MEKVSLPIKTKITALWLMAIGVIGIIFSIVIYKMSKSGTLLLSDIFLSMVLYPLGLLIFFQVYFFLKEKDGYGGLAL